MPFRLTPALFISPSRILPRGDRTHQICLNNSFPNGRDGKLTKSNALKAPSISLFQMEKSKSKYSSLNLGKLSPLETQRLYSLTGLAWMEHCCLLRRIWPNVIAMLLTGTVSSFQSTTGKPLRQSAPISRRTSLKQLNTFTNLLCKKTPNCWKILSTKFHGE